MYHKISFTTLGQTTKIEKIEDLTFNSSNYTYFKLFPKEQDIDAALFYHQITTIISNIKYLNTIEYNLLGGFTNKYKEHSKKVENFYNSLLSFTNYNDLLNELIKLYPSIEEHGLVEFILIEQMQEKIDSNENNFLYKKLLNTPIKSRTILLAKEIQKNNDKKKKHHNISIQH